MSGQLVGEVLAASDALKARGLSERGFHALVAIAEKCIHKGNRQASVPWVHIQAALYGASKRTAERAIQDAKNVGVLRVVKPGFNNNAGRVCAPIYEILPLANPVDNSTDTDTQVTESPQTDTDKPGDRYRQNDDRYRHPGVVLNGSINGSPNGDRRPPNKRDAVRLCPLCDDRGNRYVGDKFVKCTHKPEQGAA